ncbi:MAG TPA: DUF1641 domain-containing protein [Ignavibacteria bacterium]|nr:DUF1641 domain-containing protein [Ignavibacteria bacterium]
MGEINMQSQIDEINKKLDIILEEIELQRRHRREMESLKEDLTRVGKDVYLTAVDELEGVHDHLETGDIMHLGMKLLRNVKTISKSLEQLESVRDFLQDATPLSKESILGLMAKLDEYDRKGYFGFIKELSKVVDNVITAFSIEDVKSLGDHIVTILNTIKNLTQPDMLNAVNNAVSVYKNLDIEIKGKVSLRTLIKDMNTPEFRKGLAFAIQFLKNLAAQENNNLTKINQISKN